MSLKLRNLNFYFLPFSTLRPLINLKEILLNTEKLQKNITERRIKSINVELIEELNCKRKSLSHEVATLNYLRKDSEASRDIQMNSKTIRKDLIMELVPTIYIISSK